MLLVGCAAGPLKKPEDLKVKAWGKQFATMISEASAMRLETLNAFDLGHHIAKQVGLFRFCTRKRTPEALGPLRERRQVHRRHEPFSARGRPGDDALRTMGDFLVDVALLTDADQDDEDDTEVSLMTVHASKGLELRLCTS